MIEMTMKPKQTTNSGSPVSDYTMKIHYEKPRMKAGKLRTEWTFRGDTYLKVCQANNIPVVDQLEALIYTLITENEYAWKVTIYNNTLPHTDGQNTLYTRLYDVVSNGKNLQGYYIKKLKKYGLL